MQRIQGIKTVFMDTQDAQKTSNRAPKKTLKQKKTGSGLHFGIGANMEQVQCGRKACSTATES